jgi:hypothetical protein
LSDHPECVAPLSSQAIGEITIPYNEPDDVQCRITVDFSGSGTYIFCYFFVYWDGGEIASGEWFVPGTYNTDFTVTGVPDGFGPVDLQIVFAVLAGRLDTGPCFPTCGWLDGDASATLTIGPQP